MRKRLVLLQALAILIAMFQYDMRAAGQDEGRYSSRILCNPCLTARYMYYIIKKLASSYQVAFQCQHLHNCMGLVEVNYTVQIYNIISKLHGIICIPLSRIPLAGSCVDERLATTGQVNRRARVRIRQRQIFRRCYRIPLWMVLHQTLTGILHTYGSRKVGYSLIPRPEMGMGMRLGWLIHCE